MSTDITKACYLNQLHKTFFLNIQFCKAVGCIDQMEVDSDAKPEKESDSSQDPKSSAKPPDNDKSKAKRKLYVGTQALDYRRDHMEVSFLFFICITVGINPPISTEIKRILWVLVPNGWYHTQYSQNQHYITVA